MSEKFKTKEAVGAEAAELREPKKEPIHNIDPTVFHWGQQ